MNRVVVPDDSDFRERIIHEHHDSPSAGHRGITKTIELDSRNFYWPSLRWDVTAYVAFVTYVVETKLALLAQLACCNLCPYLMAFL
jgi:hypothetical protein